MAIHDDTLKEGPNQVVVLYAPDLAPLDALIDGKVPLADRLADLAAYVGLELTPELKQRARATAEKLRNVATIDPGTLLRRELPSLAYLFEGNAARRPTADDSMLRKALADAGWTSTEITNATEPLNYFVSIEETSGGQHRYITPPTFAAPIRDARPEERDLIQTVLEVEA